MNLPSVDIKDILVAHGSLSLVFGTDLFIGKEPTAPDNCVTIFDTPGYPPDKFHDQSVSYERPSIQIRVRGNSYLTTGALIDSIKNVLHNSGPEVWNGTIYSSIFCSQEPALLDWDQNDRARFVTTFEIQRHE